LGRNIEIKAKLPDSVFDKIKVVAAELATQPPEVLFQNDTFFEVPFDRLKLREFDSGTAELIAYSREDRDEPELSRYTRVAVQDPLRLKECLRQTIGIRGVVKKRRDLFICRRTRIHLDTVENLGKFLELEVVLDRDESLDSGRAVAQEFISRLSIDKDWLVSTAYIDLLEERDSIEVESA
jgi:predicted adenylyl cyclase CyaB